MLHYDIERLKASVEKIIIQNITPDAWDWLQIRLSTHKTGADFNTTFAAIPRKTGKLPVSLNAEQTASLTACRNGFSVENWSVDRLTRVWLLLQLDSSDQDKYYRSIENLFLAAEMNELVALYSALPLLTYPEIWIQRCSEGNRSNIGSVLEAIMYNNPYPSENLSLPAWNQLILKAFFTEKQVHRIIGLNNRANKELANTLTDYASERWAAGRKTDPMLWSLVGRFIDDKIFNDITIGLNKQNITEQEAIALAITESAFEPAKALLKENTALRAAIEGKKLNWVNFTDIKKND